MRKNIPRNALVPLLRHEVTVSVTVFVQQFAQEFTPPLRDAQNEVITLVVLGREVSGIHKAMDVALRFASRFEQCLYRGAVVNVFSQQSPPFLLVLPD